MYTLCSEHHYVLTCTNKTSKNQSHNALLRLAESSVVPMITLWVTILLAKFTDPATNTLRFVLEVSHLIECAAARPDVEFET